MHRILVAFLVGSPLVATAASDVSAAEPAASAATAASAAASGVLIGVGAGPAALVRFDDGGGDGGSILRVRVGAARTARVAFGFEGALVATGGVQLGSYDVGVTFFPWHSLFWLRGAFGLSTLGSAERGANVLLGAGLALGSARGANFTVNLEAQHHRTSTTGVVGDHGTSSVSAWLGLEWR